MNAIRCLQQEKLNRTVVRLGREASSEDDQATCSQGHGLCKDMNKLRKTMFPLLHLSLDSRHSLLLGETKLLSHFALCLLAEEGNRRLHL